jgi:hypothetical protein
MTYARSRLWLGISGVGTTVLLSAGALVFDLPHRLIHPSVDQSFGTALAAIALTWMLHAALLLPLDFIGGVMVVPHARGPLRWLSMWLRGITVQWCWFALAAALLLRTAQQFGVTKALLVFLLLQLVLLSRQGVVAWLVGGLRMRAVSPKLAQAAVAVGLTEPDVREIDCDDRAFVGGWSGGNGAPLWVPSHWVSELTSEQLTVAIARRVSVRDSGLRRRGVLVAQVWTTAGFAIAASSPHADLVTAAGFVSTMAWFTLWSFLGVLVLPSLSRPAVFAADRRVALTYDPAVVASTIAQLDAWQDDESERSALVETIFHPVPSRAARQHAIDGVTAGDAATPSTAAWHATRMMLFLSWAGLGGLARAVHCNIGRPSLWAMFPGD